MTEAEQIIARGLLRLGAVACSEYGCAITHAKAGSEHAVNRCSQCPLNVLDEVADLVRNPISALG